MWSMSFNETIPTINGTAPNDIWPVAHKNLSAQVITQYYNEAPIVGAIRGCPGTCRARLNAPALSATCVTHQVPVNYTQPTSQKEMSNIVAQISAPPLDRKAFLVTSSLLEGVNEPVDLVTGWSSTENCVGVFNYRVCTLYSAIGQYDVSISGNKMTFDNAARPSIIALANNTQADHSSPLKYPGSGSTFAIVADFMYFLWESYIAFYTEAGTIQTVELKDDVADRYTVNTTGECWSYSDPYEDIMADLNKIMVYMGVQAARENASYLEMHMDPGWPIHTTTVGTMVGDHNVFKSEFRYFIAAALVELACILLVAPTYWGVRMPIWKRLTRTMRLPWCIT